MNEEMSKIVRSMQSRTEGLSIPISSEDNSGDVRLIGTGGLVRHFGRLFLLSCEHVIREQGNLAFRLPGAEDYVAIDPNKFVTLGYPYDLALGPVSIAAPNAVACIVEHDFALFHQSRRSEILFMKGHAGENSSFAFDTLSTPSTSYGTQELIDKPDADDRLFFRIGHQPEQTTFLDDGIRFESPQGFSGSLLWDTNSLSARQLGEIWLPERALITGLVCRWTTDDPGIRILRVEHIRSFLLRALEELGSHLGYSLSYSGS